MLATSRAVAPAEGLKDGANASASAASARGAVVEGQTVSPPAKRKRVAAAKSKGKRPAKIHEETKREGDDDDEVEEKADPEKATGKTITTGGRASAAAAATAAPSAAANAPGEPPAQPEKRKRGRRKLIHDEEERKIRRKMQCKLNQRRYRARQRGVITTLSLESEKMTDNLQELEAYHRFLSEFDSERTEVESHRLQGVEFHDKRPQIVVNQFVRVFRHGFALHSVEVGDLQEKFLRFAMDASLVSQGATQHGVDALILQLKRYTSYHAVFEIQPESFEVMGALASYSQSTAIVHVAGKLHLRISRDTVMLLYPHIIDDEELNSRVVGQEIYPTFSMVFHFNEHAKVAKFEFGVDFTLAFMQLLGNVTFTARLLDRAIITQFAELGVDPHGEMDAKPKANKQLSLKFILL